jgi:hypothetical protein
MIIFQNKNHKIEKSFLWRSAPAICSSFLKKRQSSHFRFLYYEVGGSGDEATRGRGHGRREGAIGYLFGTRREIIATENEHAYN